MDYLLIYFVIKSIIAELFSGIKCRIKYGHRIKMPKTRILLGMFFKDELDLMGLFLTDEDMYYLHRFIKRFRFVDLSFNKFTCSGLKLLADGNFDGLDLSGNFFRDNDIIVLAKSDIRYLKLNINFITDAGVHELVNGNIKYLSFCGYQWIDDDGLCDLPIRRKYDFIENGVNITNLKVGILTYWETDKLRDMLHKRSELIKFWRSKLQYRCALVIRKHNIYIDTYNLDFPKTIVDIIKS